jgi:hypothetical protein
MKNEITVGQALTILVTLLVVLVGWGVSVEVRIGKMETELTLHKETLNKIEVTVRETHTAAVKTATWVELQQSIKGS